MKRTARVDRGVGNFDSSLQELIGDGFPVDGLKESLSNLQITE